MTIAIDLGTTNSAVAVFEGGEAKIIPNSEGKNTTPSIVAFTDKGEVLVGETAKRQAVTNPERTIEAIKRIMGMQFSEPKCKEAQEKVQYKIIDKNGLAAVEIDGKIYTPQEISSKILIKLKNDAEAYLGKEVTDVVITVPAYFNDAQRKATQEAGVIAGLKVLRIVNEPTAASLAYGQDSKGEEKVCIVDFGGGTLDISILEIDDGTFEVLSTDGNAFLGGKDIDQKVVDYITKEFEDDTGINLNNDKMAMQRLYDSAEIAKKELSTTMETEINLPFITMNDAGPQHLIKKITRAKFDSLIVDIVKESIEHITTALKDASLSPSDINEIIMVGGSTRIPLVQTEVQKYFGGKNLNKSLNPDEVVAIGAAVQAGVLTGDVKDVLLLDVTPLTLGIETMGSIVAPVVEKGTTIPVKKSQIFTTAEDNQPAVSIVVTQGEAKLSKDNKMLGQFTLEGIAPGRRGEAQIEVTFDIDSNGVLNVSAVDKTTGKEQKITISGSSGLSDDEIAKMIQDAEESNSRNKDKLEAIESKNTLDGVIAGVKSFIEDNTDDNTEILENAVKEAEETSKEDKTKSEYESAKEKLEKIYQEEAQKIMSNKTEQGTENQNNPSEDDIIDAEVE